MLSMPMDHNISRYNHLRIAYHPCRLVYMVPETQFINRPDVYSLSDVVQKKKNGFPNHQAPDFLLCSSRSQVQVS